MKYAIIVDSSSGIKNGELQDVFVIPMVIARTTKNKTNTLRDGVDIKTADMLHQMISGENYKTASPIMGDCVELLNKIEKSYDEIYILSIPSCISGTFNQWKLVSNDFDNVFVYNTPGVGNIIRWMVEDIKKIKDVDNKLVSKYINDSFDKNKICVVLNDVKYLVKGGRLNSLKGFLATMLKFKVIVELSNSGVQLVGKTNKINAIGDIVDPLLSKTIKYNGNNINKLCIFTSGIDGGKFNVDEIKNIIIKHFSFKDVTFAELPSVIAVHVGPNYIGIAMQTK